MSTSSSRTRSGKRKAEEVPQSLSTVADDQASIEDVPYDEMKENDLEIEIGKLSKFLLRDCSGRIPFNRMTPTEKRMYEKLVGGISQKNKGTYSKAETKLNLLIMNNIRYKETMYVHLLSQEQDLMFKRISELDPAAETHKLTGRELLKKWAAAVYKMPPSLVTAEEKETMFKFRGFLDVTGELRMTQEREDRLNLSGVYEVDEDPNRPVGIRSFEELKEICFEEMTQSEKSYYLRMFLDHEIPVYRLAKIETMYEKIVKGIAAKRDDEKATKDKKKIRLADGEEKELNDRIISNFKDHSRNTTFSKMTPVHRFTRSELFLVSKRLKDIGDKIKAKQSDLYSSWCWALTCIHVDRFTAEETEQSIRFEYKHKLDRTNETRLQNEAAESAAEAAEKSKKAKEDDMLTLKL